MFSVRKLFSKPPSNRLGQGLIEIIVAIAIATLLILALVSLSTRATRNSDIAKGKDQASKLAAEGMEVIRNLKTSGIDSLRYAATAGCTGSSSGPGSEITWAGLFGNNVPDPSCSNSLGRPGYFVAPGVDGCPAEWCLRFSDSDSASAQVPVGNRTYTRTAYVADTPSILAGGKSSCNVDPADNDWGGIKQFSVVVDWTDVGGAHQIVNTNCIAL